MVVLRGAQWQSLAFTSASLNLSVFLREKPAWYSSSIFFVQVLSHHILLAAWSFICFLINVPVFTKKKKTSHFFGHTGSNTLRGQQIFTAVSKVSDIGCVRNEMH